MSANHDKRVLITGATGFLGSRLLSLLQDSSFAVHAVCRQQPHPAVAGLADEWHQLDLTDMNANYQDAVRHCHAVVHLAGQAHDPTADASSYERLNHIATRRLAEAAAAEHVRHFIFMSTIKVNGGDHALTVPGYRATDRVAPQDDYGVSKWHGEQALRAICATTSMHFTVLRPPLIYGPGVRANFLSLMQLVRRGWPLPLGAIRNRRTLVYIDNLCSVIRRLLEQEAVDNRTYVVGDETLSTPALVRAIADGLGVKARLLPVPVFLLNLAGNIMGRRSMIERLTQSLVVDDSALRRDLGWQPPVTMAEAMQETATWFVHRRD